MTISDRLVNLRGLYEDAMNTRDLKTQRIWHSAIDGAWPDVTAEIDRLTGEVSRLEKNYDKWADRDLLKSKADKADALAEAVNDADFEHAEMPNDDFGVYVIDGPTWEEILKKAKAYRDK